MQVEQNFRATFSSSSLWVFHLPTEKDQIYTAMILNLWVKIQGSRGSEDGRI